MERLHDQRAASMKRLLERLEPLDSSSDAVIACDEEAIIVYANAATEKLLGWDSGALIGRRVATIVPEGLRSSHENAFARYVATRQPKVMGRWMMMRGLCADGTQVPLHILLTELQDDLALLVVGRMTTNGHEPASP